MRTSKVLTGVLMPVVLAITWGDDLWPRQPWREWLDLETPAIQQRSTMEVLEEDGSQ